MSELFLVRHAQASYGTDDYDRLSGLGHDQARWLGEYFRDRGLAFDRVICGDMLRHRETVSGIFSGMSHATAEPYVDPDWNEFDFETLIRAFLEQHPEESPPPDAPVKDFTRLLRRSLAAWSEDRLVGAIPERWPHFEERIRRGLETATAKGNGQRVLVVSSGGAISMALRQVLEAPPRAMVQMNLQLRNSSISHLFINSSGAHFSGFNHVPHLDHPERSESVTYY